MFCRFAAVLKSRAIITRRKNFRQHYQQQKGTSPVSSPVTSPRKPLTNSEITLAFVIGGGLTLLIFGYGLAAAQAATPNFDPSNLSLMMLIGGILVVIGFIAWLVIVRPWVNFDNWATPLYTGHEHEHHDDDLTHVDGINEKTAKVLNAVGIHTFADLAARNPEELDRIVRDAGIRVVGKTSNWVEQAKLIASQPASTSVAGSEAAHSPAHH
jgi:hypothetical protein